MMNQLCWMNLFRYAPTNQELQIPFGWEEWGIIGWRDERKGVGKGMCKKKICEWMEWNGWMKGYMKN